MSQSNKSYPDGTAARIIEVALAEIGTVETGENLTKYGKFTKADGLPWCGSFCNWVFHTAGVKIPSMVSTAAGAHKMKELGRWIEDHSNGGCTCWCDHHSRVGESSWNEARQPQ